MEEVEESGGVFVVFSRSTPKAVLMSYKHFKQLEAKPENMDFESSDAPRGLDFFINPPKEFLIRKRGIDVVKEIRRLRGYDE